MEKKKRVNAIKFWAEDDRPREKMQQKGYAALSDAELLAILIQSGTKEKSAVDLAREVLKLGNKNLSKLGKMSPKDFQVIKGIGEARAIAIAAALELGRRRQLSEGIGRKIIHNTKQAAEILLPLLSDLNHERFCILCLSMKNQLLHYEFISMGGVAGTVVDLKIIFKTALQHLSSRLIVAHNHPSGNLYPSASDIATTEKIKHAALLMDMQLIDHLIIGDDKYYSFADEGLL